ncbi:polyketide synthase [Plenodomus lingam]|nr:polyketide synthase [Plenodomus lingam]
MSYEQWQTAVRPKVAGTLNLHNNLPGLRYFIMLSSGTAITGNVSQANYAAGNTFQDTLARHRTLHGEPAISINLGPVDDVGYVAEQGEDVLKRVDKAVTSMSLSVNHVMQLIEGGIIDPLKKTGDKSQIITCFPRYEALPDNQGVKDDKRFGTLRLGDEGVASTGGNGLSASRVNELTQELVSNGRSTGESAARKLVSELITEELSELFSIDPNDIDPGMPLTHHGVDSLVAVRVRNWLISEVKARVAIFEILQSPSLTDFAALVASRSSLITSCV